MGQETFLDTNALLWLHQGDHSKFTKPGLELIDSSILFFSPMVRLELNYLWERGKIILPPGKVIENLKSRVPLFEDPSSFSVVMDKAEELTWTGDTFDRVITAQAMVHDAPLITKDKLIRENYEKAMI